VGARARVCVFACVRACVCDKFLENIRDGITNIKLIW